MTKQVMMDILRDISQYTLPVYTIEGKEYVPLENADYLRTLAKDALNSRADYTDRPKRHYVGKR